MAECISVCHKKGPEAKTKLYIRNGKKYLESKLPAATVFLSRDMELGHILIYMLNNVSNAVNCQLMVGTHD